METFTEAKPFIRDPGYSARRRRYTADLKRLLGEGEIDAPIAPLMERIIGLQHCFTLQSCYGHFREEDGREGYIVERAPPDVGEDRIVHYRIAYVAFCIQEISAGRKLLEDFRAIPDLDPDYIQFGSAGWFWNRCGNSYVLQVEPKRCACEDSVDVEVSEAYHIQAIRDEFYAELERIVREHSEP